MIYKLNVEAIQLLNSKTAIEQCLKFSHVRKEVQEIKINNGFVLKTEDGIQRVHFGDWLIRCNDKLYACNQGTFEKAFRINSKCQ